MIRYERKDTEKALAAKASLASQKARKGSYNTTEVNSALSEMFRGKCYICEVKDASSYQIEHLIPHQGNLDLKFDWNNLFWSCAHCNNIKNAKYNPILDCSKVEVDKKIAFRREGFFGTDEKLLFQPLDDNEDTQNTAKLLNDVYYGNTPQKKIESVQIRKKLRESLSRFKNLVRDYYELEPYEQEDVLAKINAELGAGAEFVAFKRWLLWDNRERYYKLIELCHLD